MKEGSTMKMVNGELQTPEYVPSGPVGFPRPPSLSSDGDATTNVTPGVAQQRPRPVNPADTRERRVLPDPGPSSDNTAIATGAFNQSQVIPPVAASDFSDTEETEDDERVTSDEGDDPPRRRAEDVRELIATECDAVKEMLLNKNEKYGNSALAPRRIFSRASAIEQILVRIDDKIARLETLGVGDAADEDTVFDLLGYLVLLRVARRLALE